MKPLNEYIHEGMTNPTAMAKTIKTWVMECIPGIMGDDDTSLEQIGRTVEAIITGLRQCIHEYEKKCPENTKTLEFIKELTRNIVSTYERSF